MDELTQLQELLNNRNAGPCDEKVQKMLAEAWYLFSGTEGCSMYGYKIRRAENLYWEPPRLTFQIERHGGTALGSTQAELQDWNINVESGEVIYGICGRRQLYSMDKKWNHKEVVEELTQMISSGADDERIQWRDENKTSVKIIISKVVPANNKQTQSDRRRRFRREMLKRMAGIGFHEQSLHLYEKKQ